MIMTKPRDIVDPEAAHRRQQLEVLREHLGIAPPWPPSLVLTREDFTRLAKRCQEFADKYPNAPPLPAGATIDDVLAVSPWYVRPPARAAIWLLKQRRRQELPR